MISTKSYDYTTLAIVLAISWERYVHSFCVSLRSYHLSLIRVYSHTPTYPPVLTILYFDSRSILSLHNISQNIIVERST